MNEKLSHYFNKLGADSKAAATNPAILTTMCVMALVTSPFSLPLAVSFLAMPTTMFGIGLGSGMIGRAMSPKGPTAP